MKALNVILLVTLVSVLLAGCVTQEITRKADWETDFYDIHFVNHRYGWIVGDNGLIVHTKDGGQTWRQQATEIEGDFNAVYFANEKKHGFNNSIRKRWLLEQDIELVSEAKTNV